MIQDASAAAHPSADRPLIAMPHQQPSGKERIMGCALDQALRRLNFIQGDSFAGAGRADFGKVAKMAYDLERAAATLADEKTPPRF